MTLTDEQFRNRVAEITRQELEQPEIWQYVSFADKGFNGAVIIKAHGINDALMKINLLQLNPHGEVLCIPFEDEKEVPDAKYRNRLLTKEDVQEIWPEARSIREWEEREKQ